MSDLHIDADALREKLKSGEPFKIEAKPEEGQETEPSDVDVEVAGTDYDHEHNAPNLNVDSREVIARLERVVGQLTTQLAVREAQLERLLAG